MGGLWVRMMVEVAQGFGLMILFSCSTGRYKGQPSDKDLFLKLLKAKYKALYNTVIPIPFVRDRLYCVDRVFIEGGIEYRARSWVPLDSYHGVFINPRIESTRRFVEGEPGYGKSTLALQYAYDWCNKVDGSYLKDIDVLILLRLRQLGGVKSIHKAIQQFILPSYAQFSEDDIESMMRRSSSVVVILDGFDEYPGENSKPISDVMKMIMTPVFHQFEVIFTSRVLPKLYPPGTKRLRLIGFNDKAQDEYIRKAVVGDDAMAAGTIRRQLKENPILGDLCQVPLLFVMFAHMSHENKDFRAIKTVTSFFQYMIKCFHSHIRNKMNDANVQRHYLYEEEHRKLDNIAFESLSNSEQRIVWRKQKLVNRLGKDFYDQYIRTGILVEEEVPDNVDVYGSPSHQRQTDVRFFHKVFCEWYAAHYLVEYAVNKAGNLMKVLRHMDPFDLQYCYRFACGLSPDAANKIIDCLQKRKVGDKFAILCILEKGSRVENILGNVKTLCSRGIELNNGDNTLVQRATIQLLQIASTHGISVSDVWLNNCFNAIDFCGGINLQLKSNLSLPVLTTLKKLTIWEEGRSITTEELVGILQYLSKCLELQKVWFGWCLQPQFVQPESVSFLRSRKIEVYCQPKLRPGFIVVPKYRLNLQTGLWEHVPLWGRREMTVEDRQREVEYVRRIRYREDMPSNDPFAGTENWMISRQQRTRQGHKSKV